MPSKHCGRHVMLPVIWVTCGLALAIAALRSRRHPEARRAGRIAFGALFLGGGAAGNSYMLLRGDDYSTFAEGSQWSFVRETWGSLVVPYVVVFIGLLIAFELAVGLLALGGGRRTQVAYAAAILFHVALLSFGWGFALWSGPIVAALVTLLRREREGTQTPAPPARTLHGALR